MKPRGGDSDAEEARGGSDAEEALGGNETDLHHHITDNKNKHMNL